MVRVSDNANQLITQLGNLQGSTQELNRIITTNKEASGRLADLVRLAIERLRYLTDRQQTREEGVNEELEALLRSANEQQQQRITTIIDTLNSAPTSDELNQLANDLESELQRGRPPPGAEVELQPMGQQIPPAVGGKRKTKNSKGGYPRTPTKGEVVVGYSSRRRTKRTTKTQTKSKSRR